MTRAVRVGARSIGPGHPCFIAAEVGINHNGDMDLARRAIEAAAKAGADGVKFQNYATADFLDADDTLTYTYRSQGREITERQWDMFKRCELSEAQLALLKAHCDRCGIVFFSTPTSEAGARLLKRLGAPIIKNGSDFLTHVELIRCMGSLGLPTVLSTGMAQPEEIGDAVAAFREGGGKDLLLLHCTSSYPTPAADINLSRIPVLARTYDCLAGFSDHSEGTPAAAGSVALGACFIEKHFTVDRALPGPDHWFSSDPAEFAELVRAVRRMELALGDDRPGPAASESVGRASYRLSCQAAAALPPGTQLAKEHIMYRRPGSGLPPKLCRELVGRVLARPVARGHLFAWEDFDA